MFREKERKTIEFDARICRKVVSVAAVGEKNGRCPFQQKWAKHLPQPCSKLKAGWFDIVRAASKNPGGLVSAAFGVFRVFAVSTD